MFFLICRILFQSYKTIYSTREVNENVKNHTFYILYKFLIIFNVTNF